MTQQHALWARQRPRHEKERAGIDEKGCELLCIELESASGLSTITSQNQNSSRPKDGILITPAPSPLRSERQILCSVAGVGKNGSPMPPISGRARPDPDNDFIMHGGPHCFIKLVPRHMRYVQCTLSSEKRKKVLKKVSDDTCGETARAMCVCTKTQNTTYIQHGPRKWWAACIAHASA